MYLILLPFLLDAGEMFAEVIWKSTKINSVQTDLELPIVTSAGISLFRDLKVMRLIWWDWSPYSHAFCNMYIDWRQVCMVGVWHPTRAPRNTHHTNVLPREDLEDPAPVHRYISFVFIYTSKNTPMLSLLSVNMRGRGGKGSRRTSACWIPSWKTMLL